MKSFGSMAVATLLLASPMAIAEVLGPSGKRVHQAKCRDTPQGCFGEATRVCQGQYQVLHSERRAGGLIADLLPGPFTWYGMTFRCGPSEARRSPPMSVSMQKLGGIYAVPAQINGALTLYFAVDSGAADVSIPADVVLTLKRTGTLAESDFLGKKTYVLADGKQVPSETFRIRSLRVGSRVVKNVTASVAPIAASPLLGQSFLGRFKSWSIDNNRHVLILN